MPLSPGSRLGHYSVTALIGEGGMGQVWQATDTRLNRQVALKILPDAFAEDPERLARFQREAQVLASLNHPNIAQIHGIEKAEGTRALVLELVEGPTLADRIARGPIPIDEALPIAKQVAEAMEAAHEAGVIHRDLKPANIKVREDGTVKVLDFGLAKAVDTAPEGDPSQSPTLTAAATQMGVIMGTAAYMSPEQAAGKATDRRSDVWSFGVVVFEMLTGKQLFSGETVSHVLGAVLQVEPDWTALPEQTPEPMRRLLRRSLRKQIGKRTRHIGDAINDLEDAMSEPSLARPVTESRNPRNSSAVPWLIAVAATGVAAFVGLAPRATSDTAAWYQMLPPDSVAGIAPEPALSPDGTLLAFKALGASAESTLWLRSFDSPSVRELAGTDGAMLPFWSPDGQSIGFFDYEGTTLKRIDIADGRIQDLADVANPRGATWGSEDIILYSPGHPSPLFAVPASGGEPHQVTELGSESGGHMYPHFLPNGRQFLFVEDAGQETPSRFTLRAGSLDSPDVRSVPGIASRVEYVDGTLLFGERDVLFAQRFDAERLELHGERMRLADGLGLSFGTTVSYAFSASDGILVYSHGGNMSDTRLAMLDRVGRRLPMPDISGEIYGLDVAPDGSRVAYERRDPMDNTVDIWIADLVEGVELRFRTGRPWTGMPLWDPDGERLLSTSWTGRYAITDVRTGDEKMVAVGANRGGWPMDWSSDGNYVVFQEVEFDTLSDIWLLSLSDGEVQPYLRSTNTENEPELSADGRWLAYISDESGQVEIYVESFPDHGGKTRISPSGGRRPRWGPTGRELFYIDAAGMLVVATLSVEDSQLQVTERQSLFEAPRLIREERPQYEVLGDGERFIFNEISRAQPRSMTVIPDWMSLLK